MPVSGAESAIHNRVLTTTLAHYGKTISNEIARNDAIVGVFGAKDRIDIITGGKKAVEILDTAENPNFAFRSIYADSAKGRADTRKEVAYGWATIDGVVAINKIEENMNAGSAKIHDIAVSDIENAKNTIIRKIADALRASSPGDYDPESIITIVPDTAKASQTTTTGELSRTSNTFWRSEYSAVAMDLSTTAGLEALYGFYYNTVAKGTSKIDQPDFALTDGLLFAALAAGHGDALRRFDNGEKRLELGFDYIKVLNMIVIADPALPTGDMRLINTNFMRIQVLRSPNMKDIGEKSQSMPFTFEPFIDDDDSAHRSAFGYLTFAVTCKSLQRQGIATNCS